jgi:glycine/D-amino acid oxidase-like deaminating enzyme
VSAAREQNRLPSVAPRLPPWWADEAGDGGTPEPPLEGDASADVCIIGGGFTGLWTALALREREPSARIVLLEADQCGSGPSGRNGGFVHGYWASLTKTQKALSDEDAVALARAGEHIIPAMRALPDDVWLREGGLLMVSTTAAQDRAIDEAVRAADKAGAPEHAVGLDRDGVAKLVESPAFRRGVFFPECATVQPARLVRALRRAALDAGVALHEHTRVENVADGVVTTARGSVRADATVVATNAAMSGWGPVRRHVTNFGSYVVLTEPVPELLREIGWADGLAVIDARMFIHYFRTTNDGRMLMGSGTGPIGFGGRVDERFTQDAPSSARAEWFAQTPARARSGARGAVVGWADRRFLGPPALLRHRPGHSHPLRPWLLGARCRTELARRPDPGLARRRPRRRMDATAAGAPPSSRAAAGAAEAHRRRRRSGRHHRV